MFSRDFPALDPPGRYFFVHIPKTGGTSLFNWLERLYGHENCCEHIETIVLPTPSDDAIRILSQYQIVSGHVPIDWWGYFAEAGFVPITVMRDPIDQFYSHINHMLRHAHDLTGDDFLSAMNAKLEVSAGHFLEHGDARELAYFESPQSKTIFGGSFPWRSRTLTDRVSWLRETYAAVMLTETMGNELMDRLRGPTRADKPFPHINVSFYDRKQLTPKQRGVLMRLLGEDIALYRTVRDGPHDG